MTRARPLLIPLLCLALVACGERDEEEPATAQQEPAAAETATPSTGGAGTLGAISDDVDSKPEIPKPSGDPPAELQAEDVVVGTGAAAKAGDTVDMQYVGVSWSTGEQFDASWDRGSQPFSFQLGGGQVIPGWDEGIVGMKEGGRRTLIIPPDKAYGPAGQGPIGPNETLVFVVDLERIQ